MVWIKTRATSVVRHNLVLHWSHHRLVDHTPCAGLYQSYPQPGYSCDHVVAVLSHLRVLGVRLLCNGLCGGEEKMGV